MPDVWLLGRTSAASTAGRSYKIQSVSCVQRRPSQRSRRKLNPLMVAARNRRGIWRTPFRSRTLAASKDGDDMVIPKIECLALLRLPIVSLINTGYSSARSTDMIQHGFGDLEANAQPLKAGRQCPAKIVQTPTHQLSVSLSFHSPFFRLQTRRSAITQQSPGNHRGGNCRQGTKTVA